MFNRFYYSIWTDLILQLKEPTVVEPFVKKHWKFYTQFMMSFAMGIDYMFILTLISNGYKPPLLKLDAFSIHILNIFLVVLFISFFHGLL
jgi:hypothetical protein